MGANDVSGDTERLILDRMSSLESAIKDVNTTVTGIAETVAGLAQRAENLKEATQGNAEGLQSVQASVSETVNRRVMAQQEICEAKMSPLKQKVDLIMKIAIGLAIAVGGEIGIKLLHLAFADKMI